MTLRIRIKGGFNVEARNSDNEIVASGQKDENDNVLIIPDTPYTVKDQDDNVLDTGSLVSAKAGQIINVVASAGMVVDFSADVLDPETGETVTLTDESTNTPTDWYWNFGSGATPAYSTDQNPTVVYNTAGTKTITLLAGKVGSGGKKVRTGYISVTNAWDALALDFFAACAADGFTVPDADKILYNNAYVRMRATANVLSELDYLNLFILRSSIAEATRKGIAARDMIDTTRKGTYHNDYTGSLSSITGLVGNSTDFGFLTEFNPSTATKYTQNSATYGYLCLSDTAKANAWTISCIDSGYTKYCQIVPEHTSEGYQIINEGNSIGSFSYQVPKAQNHNWRDCVRTASNVAKDYENGMLVAINTMTSGSLPNNKVGLLGIYNGSWFGSAPGYTPSKIGAYYAGSGALDRAALQQIINEELLVPIGAGFNKNIVAIGDSIFSSQLEGLYSAMYKKTIADLDDFWTLTNLAASGRFATDMASDMATRVNPFFNVTFNKNVCWIAIGTNDLAAGATGSQLYGYINTIASGAKAAGMTVVISGIISRKGLGGAQAGFDTQRGNYNTLMLADFDTAHPTIANCWTPSSVTYADVYIDIYADGDFNDADDTGFFNVDKTHLNSTGNDLYSTRYCQPLLLTF